MNKEMSIQDMIYLIKNFIRRARMYNKLVWQAAKRGEKASTFKSLRYEAIKKARHLNKIVKTLSA